MWNRNTRLNPALTLFSALCAVAAQAQSPSSNPSIAASVNGSRQVQVGRGTPLLVSAVIQHSRQYAADAALLDVSHGDAGWTSAVQLAVVDSQGQPVSWMIQVTPSTEPTLHLDGSAIGIVSWRIAPEDTTNIANGVYQLTAILDNTDLPVDGWQGSVASVAVSITINDPPATLSLLDDADQAQLFASYYVLAGDLAKSLAALDDLFTRQPDQITRGAGQRRRCPGCVRPRRLRFSSTVPESARATESPVTAARSVAGKVTNSIGRVLMENTNEKLHKAALSRPNTSANTIIAPANPPLLDRTVEQAL